MSQVVWTLEPFSAELSSRWQRYLLMMDEHNSIDGLPSILVGTGDIEYNRVRLMDI